VSDSETAGKGIT